jgi:hypothetical protein
MFLEYTQFHSLVHPEIVVSHDILGFSPIPYAPYVIDHVEFPMELMIIVSLVHVSHFLKSIESQGRNIQEFILAIVFHGVDIDVPLLESLPEE